MLRELLEQTFAAFSPAVSENIDPSKYMKKLVESKIFFPVSFHHKVLIKNGKTALGLAKSPDIKHTETNITDVTSEVAPNKADT